MIPCDASGVGSNVGFVFAWFFVGCYLLITAEGFSVFGGFVHDYLKTNISADIPWWAFTTVAIVYVVSFAWRGIALSVDYAVAELVVGNEIDDGVVRVDVGVYEDAAPGLECE